MYKGSGAMKEFLTLSAGWQFKQRDQSMQLEEDFNLLEGWNPTSVPGCIHTDLLGADLIPDPFYGMNEQEVQWVGESDWLYRYFFTIPDEFEKRPALDLCFDGLDTFATIWLNGKEILTTANMFVPYRVPIRGIAKVGHNELRILFESALRRGKELEQQYGKRAAWNTDTSRVYVRKAQYHYGWDWGPTLITAGIWREVRLEAYNARIDNIFCPAEVSEDLKSATVPVSVEIVNASSLPLSLNLILFDHYGIAISEATIPISDSKINQIFEISDPLLWEPSGRLGAQPQYRVEARLLYGEKELDNKACKFGIRRLRLLQNPLEGEEGSSFTFEVNNMPVFCRGANWIPADSFTTRVTRENYESWLQLAVTANMNMLRIWGGGIYEEEAFYDLCDELGIMVWQDFMFACGIYPAHPEFLKSVKVEAEATLRRLRNHPCLVLWNGNNEDYSIAQSLGVYDVNFEGDFTATAFPAREIYERLLPESCARLDPTRPYRPGSPYGGADADDPTQGDRHTWEIWHKQMAKYQDYRKFEGRFVSEFGMQGSPTLETLVSFLPPGELHHQSRTYEFHNKAPDGYRRLAVYLSDNLPTPANLEEYIYATQFIQAEALKYAVMDWKRRWQGKGKEYVSGVLVWQLNDCYPAISWAIADYLGKPKAAFYTLKRAFNHLAIGLDWASKNKATYWATNTDSRERNLTLELKVISLEGKELVSNRSEVTIPANCATELDELEFEAVEPLVIVAALLDNGEIVRCASLWQEPFKYLALPDPRLKITRLEGEVLLLEVKKPVKGLWLSADVEVQWSDNFLDLMPDDPQVIVASGLGEGTITACCLAKGGYIIKKFTA
ncbi:MAG: glycoside hydrolase family 2 protein [Chloroflexi bacterium]|uniref:Beta-mannosidase B n=2 Tax=Candidatus Chlorohelix allophototropha TaxID=3003348 RepID=A0A8T7LXR0_9CHLR|nr:glycoside hydrolase family 2 protein [Chloroflexota bacterium]